MRELERVMELGCGERERGGMNVGMQNRDGGGAANGEGRIGASEVSKSGGEMGGGGARHLEEVSCSNASCPTLAHS